MKGRSISHLWAALGTGLLALSHAAAATAEDALPATAGCIKLCPADPARHSLIMDPAIITALLGLFGAWAKYVYDGWRKRKTINITILTEVARLLEVTSAHLIWWSGKIKEKDTDQSLIPFQAPVFDSQMENLGSLDRRYAGAIVRFYGYVKFVNSLQETQAHYRKRRQAAEFDESYEDALKKLISIYGEIFRPAFAEYGIKASFKPVSRKA